MAQSIVTCAQTPCRKFFVDTKEERFKAMHNGWSLDVKDLNVCSNHRYRLFGEPGVLS